MKIENDLRNINGLKWNDAICRQGVVIHYIFGCLLWNGWETEICRSQFLNTDEFDFDFATLWTQNGVENMCCTVSLSLFLSLFIFYYLVFKLFSSKVVFIVIDYWVELKINALMCAVAVVTATTSAKVKKYSFSFK